MLNLVGVLALALAAPPKDAALGVPEKLDGDWQMVSIEAGGAKLPAQQVNGFSLAFKAGRFTSYMGGEKKTGTYTTDPTKKPKTMDIVPADGPDKGKTWSLIYELNGNTLRICAGEVGKERPAGFDTKGREDVILMVLRRQ